MDKVKMTTPDGVTENIEKLAALFPAAVTEMRGEDGTLRKGIDFEKLKQLLSRDIVEGGERYEFSWVGKKAAMAEAARPTTETLRPVKADSRDWDTTENLYIEGDNLAALKILQESYLGKVKMIYIDPPYNTGNDFIYRDSWTRSQRNENEQMGMYDDDNNTLFLNADTRGHYHSDWCSMIYSRLALSRSYLSDDGVIFISIDDHEISNLISIADEIFGERNRLAILVWKKKYTGGKGSSTFVDYHEYILAYARNIEQLGDISMARPEEEKGKFVNTDAYFAERGKYYTRPLKSNLDPRPTLVYPIVLPDGSSVTTQWICAKDTYEQLKAEGRIEFKDPKSSKFPVYRKYYENDAGGTVKIPSFIEVSNNNAAKEELKSLLNVSQTRDLPFQTPKPTELLQLFVQNFTSGNDYILDFFSGSASTAHAVLNANICDNKKRHFIMVQLPEANGLRGATYKNICEIGKERIRRAGDKIKAEHPDADLDIGFRVFRIDSSNMRDVFYKPEEFTQTMLGEAVSNIKPDRTDLDLLYACLLDCGVPIHLPHTTTTVDGCTIHNVDNGALMACFDEHIPHSVIRAMAAEAPLQVIFRDSAFAADADKINVTEIFKNLSPDTKVRVI